jgi:hypothetical protein
MSVSGRQCQIKNPAITIGAWGETKKEEENLTRQTDRERKRRGSRVLGRLRTHRDGAPDERVGRVVLAVMDQLEDPAQIDG